MCFACSTLPPDPDTGSDRDAVRPASEPGSVSRLPRAVGIGLIRLYRLTLSPFLGQSCRYLPTCSSYGEEAISRHGLWAGGWMTLARLQRCGPFGASGYDPVPEAIPESAHWYVPWRYGYWTGRHIDPATRLD
ncbi:membrane protein insertion efficiency factor YidD [Kaistia algarum]|nr:membrane protein insertion efficiency factor YidD [Kaistia algarum]